MASQNQVVALRAFSRPNGATVEQVGKKLGLEEKQVRGLVDRLRLKPEGKHLVNVGPHRFQVKRVASKGKRGN